MSDCAIMNNLRESILEKYNHKEYVELKEVCVMDFVTWVALTRKRGVDVDLQSSIEVFEDWLLGKIKI